MQCIPKTRFRTNSFLCRSPLIHDKDRKSVFHAHMVNALNGHAVGDPSFDTEIELLSAFLLARGQNFECCAPSFNRENKL